MMMHGILLSGYISAYILATEIIPKKYLIIVSSVNIIVDQTLNQVFSSIYFMIIGKDWKGYYLTMIVCFSLPQIILVFLLPKSPLLYYDREDFDSAREIYHKIAKFNGKQLHNFIFDEEEKFLKSKSSHS